MPRASVRERSASCCRDARGRWRCRWTAHPARSCGGFRSLRDLDRAASSAGSTTSRRPAWSCTSRSATRTGRGGERRLCCSAHRFLNRLPPIWSEHVARHHGGHRALSAIRERSSGPGPATRARLTRSRASERPRRARRELKHPFGAPAAFGAQGPAGWSSAQTVEVNGTVVVETGARERAAPGGGAAAPAGQTADIEELMRLSPPRTTSGHAPWEVPLEQPVSR